MDNEEVNKLIIAIEELIIWTKLAYGQTIRERLDTVLDSDQKKHAYEATDGFATTREIGKLVGVDQKTISSWWRNWAQAGIVEPGPDREDRPRRLISLKYFKLL